VPCYPSSRSTVSSGLCCAGRSLVSERVNFVQKSLFSINGSKHKLCVFAKKGFATSLDIARSIAIAMGVQPSFPVK